VNILKPSPKQFEKISPFKLEQIPWSPASFSLKENAPGGQSPGKHPYNADGMYYLGETQSGQGYSPQQQTIFEAAANLIKLGGKPVYTTALSTR
jgi:hypothetical protein